MGRCPVWNTLTLRDEPSVERLSDRLRVFLSHASPFVGGQTDDVSLDAIQGTEQFQRLTGACKDAFLAIRRQVIGELATSTCASGPAVAMPLSMT